MDNATENTARAAILGHIGDVAANLEFVYKNPDKLCESGLAEQLDALDLCHTAWFHFERGDYEKAWNILRKIGEMDDGVGEERKTREIVAKEPAIVKGFQVGGVTILNTLRGACSAFVLEEAQKLNILVQFPDGNTHSLTLREDNDDNTVMYGDFQGLPSFLEYATYLQEKGEI